MSSDAPSEFTAHAGTTLDALGQAASKAEQAAYKYRASTALPFNQLDFDAEYPEWSLSAHRTSSASSSRPASANGTAVLYSRSSTASPSIHDIASANGGDASQAIGFPSNPVQAIPRARGRSRMLDPKEQEFLEPDKKQAYSRGEPGHDGKVDGRAIKQRYRQQRSFPKHAVQHPSPTIRPSTMSNSRSHVDRVANPSVSSDGTDPAITMNTRLRETNRTPSSDQALTRRGMQGDGSESQAQDEDPWPIYREVVDPIIQSLSSHYEELYPQLDVSAIRQEVCWLKCTAFMVMIPVADEH